MPTNYSCTWCVLSHPANAEDLLLAYYGMGKNCLKIESSECAIIECDGQCVVSVSKRISNKMTGSIIIPAKSGQKNDKKVKKLYNKITGSIIGPAMAGPTGPFATALHNVFLFEI